jgi:hypothetical protein
MNDPTENFRRKEVVKINGAVESGDKAAERSRLVTEHGQVWDTEELSRDFAVEGFLAPFVVVRRKTDGVRGSLSFQHQPRFYFDFQEDK